MGKGELRMAMQDYKKLSKDAFNAQAETYDTDKNGKHAREQYPYVLKKISQMNFRSVLDVGCGTGEVLKSISEEYPDVRLYGIDISEEMLKQAKAKLNRKAVLSAGDADHIPFTNNEFDLIVCTDSFHHYPNPQQAVDEFYRMLKTGKFLALCDFWKPFPIRQMMNIFLPYSNEGDVKVYSKQEIIRFLQKSGFKNIDYSQTDRSGYCVVAQK